MPTFERSILVSASPAALFALTQDYARRLRWDPFLKAASLLDDAKEPGVGVRAWCVARSGFGMKTEYVSYAPPRRTAVRMTRGPAILTAFAGSWLFRPVGGDATEVTFRYSLTARPEFLRVVLDPALAWYFGRDVERRLQGLKRAVEEGRILEEPRPSAPGRRA